MKRLILLYTFFLPCMGCSTAMAHALLERSVPVAGAVLNEAPASISVFFDAELEPVFSKLIVKTQHGDKVSQDNAEPVSGDPKSLTVKLVTQAKGVYRVHWDVVSRDGHRATGDFTFTVQ